MNPPLKKFDGDRYSFCWLDPADYARSVTITLDRLREVRGGDLTAEIEVRCAREGEPPGKLVHQAKMNLVSTQTRLTVVRALAARIPESELDWGAMVEAVCFLAIEHWRVGEPFVLLGSVAPREGSRFLLEPYVEYGGPTVLFADGGSGKSLFALSIALSIATGAPFLGQLPDQQCPVLYLDWEADPETHAERMRQLCAGIELPTRPEDIPIFYRHQDVSLAESASYIKRFISENDIGFLVIDSLGLARAGEPESAEITLRLFNAARTLGIPWLGIDHVVKRSDGTFPDKPFGSVFTPNAARMTWRLDKLNESESGDLSIALINKKANNGRLAKRRGYVVQYRSDAIWYTESAVDDLPGGMAAVTQWEQIRSVIKAQRGNPQRVDDIARLLEAEGIHISEQVIRVQLGRHKDVFVALPIEKGGTAYGLRDHNPALV